MEKPKVSQAPKIAINKLAESVLDSAYKKVNEGFLGGKIPKLDLASWAIIEGLEKLNDSKIEKIQKQFFNQIDFLDSVLKLARQNGLDKLTAEQLEILQSNSGGKTEKSRKPKEDNEARPFVE